MSHKLIRFVGILILGIIIFKVVLSQTAASASPEGAVVAGSGLNQDDLPVTRVVYVTATPLPTPTMAPTEETEETAVIAPELEPLQVVERSPDFEAASEVLPTFRLVFNRPINNLAVMPFLTAEPTVGMTAYWEDGNVLLVRPVAPLESDIEYTFSLSKELAGVDGSRMADNYSWTYRLNDLVDQVDHEFLADGREAVIISLNYPLDPASLEWQIFPEVAGVLSWSSNNKVLTFASHNFFLADSRYTVKLGDSLSQLNGQPAPSAKNLTFVTEPLVGQTEPVAGSGNNSTVVTLKIPFRRSMDWLRVEYGLSITPAPLTTPVFEWDGNTLLADLVLAPDTNYSVALDSSDLTDPEGRQVSGAAIEWGFRTKELSRVVGFGNGPKLQTLQVGNGLERPSVEYSFYPNEEPMAVTFELHELALVDWQASPALSDYLSVDERPLFTWEEPAPVYEEEWYYYANQTFIPEGVGPGFYRLTMKAFGYPQDVMAILITDVGLAFRMEGDNMLAWVVDMETMTPVTADVTVYAGTTPTLVGTTDEQGFVSMSVADLPIGEEDGPLITVKAQVGEQFTVAALHYSWNTYSASQGTEKDYLLHVSLDRPVYEAGDTAYIRAVVRGLDNGQPTILPVGEILTATMHGWDADYNLIESETVHLTTGEFGVAYGEIVIPAEFAAGRYSISAAYRGVNESSGFEVVSPPAPGAPIVTVSTAPIVGQGDQLAVTVEVMDSVGAPLFDKSVGITWLESVGGGSGCYGSNGVNEWSETDRVSEQGQTDRNGRYTFTITPEMGYDYHRPYDDANIQHSIAAVVATTTNDGEVGTGFSVVEVSNVSEELLWQPSSLVQAAGQPFVVGAAVKDLAGLPVVGRAVSLQVHQVGENGVDYYYQPGQLISRVNGVSDASGAATFNVTVDQPGYYDLRLVSVDRLGNEMMAYRPLYVTGTGEAVGIPDLKLDTAANEYVVGETGQLVILAKEPGLAWLTIANHDGVRNEVVSLTENITVIDLPLGAADAPLFYVEVDMWQRSKDAHSGNEYYGAAYSRRDGNLLSRSLSISVTDLDKQLQVSVVETGETNEAGQTAVTVEVVNGRGEPVAAEVALSIVSQSLYSHYPNHSRPQYSSLFIRPTFSHVLYNSFAPRRDLSYEYGYGCGCGGGWWSDTRLPGLVMEDATFWFPGLQTDFNGQATVFVTLPDNADGWHFSASAITADGQVGEGIMN